ncbi:uncharacterized protein SPSK_00902 [Sporothrix schenckii 1099-18]|uniref:Uncharacterized protein n=1 Tax=Sporothrix schenckii 1099-18 TaxID=1397361 RepID=A0A0F2M102_SPOSC|nr:uncharacterized protein SPSK_00902 [Sporothrix schenckii 1099-18]KJR81831.1 hypothetical protein SPSK_00902 [Sporothrix schenckii 1099-18]
MGRSVGAETKGQTPGQGGTGNTAQKLGWTQTTPRWTRDGSAELDKQKSWETEERKSSRRRRRGGTRRATGGDEREVGWGSEPGTENGRDATVGARGREKCARVRECETEARRKERENGETRKKVGTWITVDRTGKQGAGGRGAGWRREKVRSKVCAGAQVQGRSKGRRERARTGANGQARTTNRKERVGQERPP